jgi:hypothetical protein
MSDTPITDAAEFDFNEDCTPEDNMVVASCDMRKLERELNEALERERVAIASWDEERHRALREAKRVLDVKADADALVLLLGSIMRDLPTNKDWLDPALERSANEALETYHTKYPQ